MGEKAVFPSGKGIVVRLKLIPKKNREKPKFQGQGVKTVCDLPFAVDDRNYLPFFDQTVFVTLTDRIRSASGEFKSTDSYRFIEEALKPTLTATDSEGQARELAERMALYDGMCLSQLSRELATPLIKHYVAYMKDPKPGADGKVYQDVKEICTLEKVEWELDRRRVPADEAERRRKAQSPAPLGLPTRPGGEPTTVPQPPQPEPKPLGLPQTKASNAPPVEPPKPQEAPTPPKEMEKVAPTREVPKELPVGMVVDSLKAYAAMKDLYGAVMKAFLAKCGAQKVTDLLESHLRHMHALVQLREVDINGGSPAACLTSHLRQRNVNLVDLPFDDAKRILVECLEVKDDNDVPF